tara:strand:+ start:110 stop:703 length:594 start_codon:yes stop_codon:yes gene_type:complete
MIKVIDNYLPKEYVDDIEKLFLKPEEHSSSEINWYYNDYTASKDADYLKRIKDNKHFFDSYQFTHIFYNMGEKNSSYFDKIIKILEDTKINWKSIERIKANFTTNLTNRKPGDIVVPHQDIKPNSDYYKNKKAISMIYYVHDTDGDTVFYDDECKKITKKVKPKKGRVVIFDSLIFHSYMRPIKSDKRVVINFIVNV